MIPQRYEILKSLAMKSVSCLALHSFGERGRGSGGRFKAAPV